MKLIEVKTIDGGTQYINPMAIALIENATFVRGEEDEEEIVMCTRIILNGATKPLYVANTVAEVENEFCFAFSKDCR
jgi:hypothetical protein